MEQTLTRATRVSVPCPCSYDVHAHLTTSSL